MILFLIIGTVVYWALGIVITILWWPISPSFALVFLAASIAYPIFAWRHADLIVAEKAGFHAPTSVQQRYLEYLGVNHNVRTHHTILVVAGVLASYRRKTILLSPDPPKISLKIS